MSVLDITQDDNIAARVGDKLTGRVAFVTGGTRGIGAAICRSLASQGAVLAAGYAGNDRAAAQFRDAFAGTYRTPVSIHKGNVGEPGDCRRTIDEVIKTHGRLDILVNNAGITSDKTVLKMSDEDWFKVLNVNLSGAFFLSQAALRHMAERGSGRIVNVSSVIGEMGNIGQANYAASKSGLFGLTKTLAREAALLLARAGKLTDPQGIGLTVNTITPGFVATEMLEWVQAHSKTPRSPWEIEPWSAFMEKRAPDSDAETLAFFAKHLGRLSKTREDVKTLFEFGELDDYVSFGGKA